MKTVKEFWICLSIFAFVSCKSSGSSGAIKDNVQNSPSVETKIPAADKKLNDIWVLTHIQNNPVKTDKKPVIEFHLNEMRFYGNTGCNQYGGSFELKNDNEIAMSPAEMTEMFCNEAINDIEFQFTSQLTKINRYSISGLTLYLKTNDQIVLQFRKVD